MERNDFLKLCQKVSVLPDGIMHTKRAIPNDLLVEYENHQYYPEKLIIGFDNGKTVNIALVHELKANCRHEIPLDLVEKLTTE